MRPGQTLVIVVLKVTLLRNRCLTVVNLMKQQTVTPRIWRPRIFFSHTGSDGLGGLESSQRGWL